MVVRDSDLPRTYWRRVAEKNGISRELFKQRIYHGWSLKRAATEAVHAQQSRKKPLKTTQLCRDAGLAGDAVRRFRKRNQEKAKDMTDRQIVDYLLARKSRPNVSRMAEEAGISRSAMYKRLKRGEA